MRHGNYLRATQQATRLRLAIDINLATIRTLTRDTPRAHWIMFCRTVSIRPRHTHRPSTQQALTTTLPTDQRTADSPAAANPIVDKTASEYSLTSTDPGRVARSNTRTATVSSR
jgi:hypothetical protein